jgi:hypothetical protein
MKILNNQISSLTIFINLAILFLGAGWKPIYDLRVNTQTKKMNIAYLEPYFKENTDK